MGRRLQAVDSCDYQSLRDALELVLLNDGPAVFPCTVGAKLDDLPASVDSGVALVVETSGSTDRPKKVWHTVSSLRAAAEQVNAELGVPGVWWQALPANYIAGVMVTVRALYSGSVVLIRKSGERLVENLVQFGRHAGTEFPALPRFTSLVPKQLAELIDAARKEPVVVEALSSFSRVLVGGQRVPEEMINAARDLGVPVTKTYGAAETAGGCVWDGTPLGGTEVDTPQNRIALSGPMLAGGYLHDPERTAQSFVGHLGKRWFVSDDIGKINDGVLSVSGRADRVIISGGVKTNLDEVESALLAEYNPCDLAVLAVADDIWGEAIGVVSSQALNHSSVEGFLRQQFGKAARLGRVVSAPDVPRLPSGKIDRRELTRLYGSSTFVPGLQ